MEAETTQEELFDRRLIIGNISVDRSFHKFVEHELLPAIGQESRAFWSGVERIIIDLTPVNHRLLEIRDDLQTKIDAWHKADTKSKKSHEDYMQFLRDIGYLRHLGTPFKITTKDVDAEIAEIAGPQLVVPVNNARFAINAANARWVSLFDALYGSNVISEGDGKAASETYNPVRGAAVIEHTLDFLDQVIPLKGASHREVASYAVEIPMRYAECAALLVDGRKVGLLDKRKFVGWSKKGERHSLVFCNHDLHIEVDTDPNHAVGKKAPGNIRDVILESAITTIQDCEDSVSSVDTQDKIQVYRNWLGLMDGGLEATFEKNGEKITRRLNRERVFIGKDGSRVILPGTSLMLVRNVGHLMTSDAITDHDGNEVFEGILDAIITTGCAISNTRQKNQLLNSRKGSIYIVKPKMHGPAEVAFSNTLFGRVEELYRLQRNTIKIGVMDEERRTSVNLHECIRAGRERLVFINTGFLDRSGDEIRTSMYAGPFLPKEEMKEEKWILAYEDRNVDIGIKCGLPGKAQIGKGMWPKPDELKGMMESKVDHLRAGASCSWVPSPIAASLHAMHYHLIDVKKSQEALARRKQAKVRDILIAPLADPVSFDNASIQRELDNNIQSILGYVVRWINDGIGCSKVPDFNDVGLMEDRATLRISSQHIANWLLHGICSEKQVFETFKNMATIVDSQNSGDPKYKPMSEDLENDLAFKASCDLVFKGVTQPNGYTEPLLHHYRLKKKLQELHCSKH